MQEFIDIKPVNGGYIHVLLDGQIHEMPDGTRGHNLEREAYQHAYNLKLSFPDSIVTIQFPDYEVEMPAKAGHYFYDAEAQTIGAMAATESVDTVVTTQRHPMLPWQADFETGDTSQFNNDPFGGGTVTVITDQPYGGTYCLSATLDGALPDAYDYQIFGPPNYQGSLIEEFYFQLGVSHDDFGAPWPNETKLLQFRLTDGVNNYRIFQCILYAGGFLAGSEENYVYELLEWTNNGIDFVGSATVEPVAATPAMSRDAWDVVRGYVRFNTTWSGGALGAGQGAGNGVLKMWVNNSLVLDHSDVNFRNDQYSLGMGRCVLAMNTQGNWPSADTTTRYVDQLIITDDVNDLPDMPSNPISRAPTTGTGTSIIASYDHETVSEDLTDPNLTGVRIYRASTGLWDLADGPFPVTNINKTANPGQSWDGSNFVRHRYSGTGPYGELNSGFGVFCNEMNLTPIYSIRWICRYGSRWHPPTNEGYKHPLIHPAGLNDSPSTRYHNQSPTGYDEACCNATQRCPSIAGEPGGSGGASLPNGTNCGNPFLLSDYWDQWLCFELLHVMGSMLYLSAWDRTGSLAYANYPGNVVYASIPDAVVDPANTKIFETRFMAVLTDNDIYTAGWQNDPAAYWDLDRVDWAMPTTEEVTNGVYLQGPPPGFVTGGV